MRTLDNIKYVIIPDVHGRTFWKEPVMEAIENNIDVVFLGDYHDTYPNEGITCKESIDNFREIIQLKKDNPDKITLLLGNHDEHYINNDERGCRMDYVNKKLLTSMFLDNWDLFEYVKTDTVGGKNFIFSHAGFLKAWFCRNCFLFGVDQMNTEEYDEFVDMLTFDTISKMDWKKMHDDKEFRGFVSEASYFRGGYAPYGSYIWADVSEHLMTNDCFDAIQIFGHSQQAVDPIMKGDNVFCLDCRRPFYLTHDGVVMNSSGNELIDNGTNRGEKISECLDKFASFGVF